MTAAAVALSLSMAYRTGRTCLHSPIAWALFAAALLASSGRPSAAADRAFGAGAACHVVGVAAPAPGGIVTPATALQLCLLFGGASLMSIGGGNSVVPEIELQAVDTYHWLTRGAVRRSVRVGTGGARPQHPDRDPGRI